MGHLVPLLQVRRRLPEMALTAAIVAALAAIVAALAAIVAALATVAAAAVALAVANVFQDLSRSNLPPDRL